MEFEIKLKNLHFYSFHGVLEEERKTGNEYKVNFSVWLSACGIGNEDELNSTISYVDLYEIVKREMEKPRNLLEKVALEIGREVRNHFPQIRRGEIEIEKVRPPIPGMLGSASVKLFF